MQQAVIRNLIKKSLAVPLQLPSWPAALRRVQAYLEPYLMLWRYWRGWSPKPPPPELQALIDWTFQGKPLYLYR